MKLLTRISAIAIVVGLILLRFCLPENDPPLFFEGLGQGQLTDPYHLTFAARNAVLYGDWNPFDFHRWDVFKYSLVSGLSYLFFLASGVSRVTANLAAVVLSTGGILLFLLGLARDRTKREVMLAALILFVNSTLFFYGRMPLLENGLIFFSGLTFFAFSRYHDRLWGCALTGALVALAALCGKLFGLFLIGPVMLTLIYLYRARAAKPIVAVLLGFAGGSLLYLASFYGTDLTSLASYYTEQTVGMYGLPPGLQSPLSFIEMLLKYGEHSLVRYNPFLMLLSALGLVAVFLSVRFEKTPRKDLASLVFCIVWFLTGIIGLMPHLYRPMRYSIFLLLPVAGYVSFVISYCYQKKISLNFGCRWLTLPGILFAVWFILSQSHVFVNALGTRMKAGAEIVYFTAPLALIITGLLFRWLRKGRVVLVRKYILMPLSILLLASLSYQGLFIYKGLLRPGQYLKTYSHELSQIMDQGATLTGPYAPAMTIDNELRGVIYMFTLSVIEENLFTQFPITHIATDRSNWDRAVKDFPFLKSSTKLVEMIVRERPIYIYRLPDCRVPPTDFERSRMYAARQSYDSALVYMSKFCEKNPESIFGRLYLAVEQSRTGDIDEATRTLDRLVDKYPNNYYIHAFYSRILSNVFEETGDNKCRISADEHNKIARRLNWRISEVDFEL